MHFLSVCHAYLPSTGLTKIIDEMTHEEAIEALRYQNAYNSGRRDADEAWRETLNGFVASVKGSQP